MSVYGLIQILMVLLLQAQAIIYTNDGRGYWWTSSSMAEENMEIFVSEEEITIKFVS